MTESERSQQPEKPTFLRQSASNESPMSESKLTMWRRIVLGFTDTWQRLRDRRRSQQSQDTSFEEMIRRATRQHPPRR